MTTIAFVRHGLTDWNKEGRFQGERDIPLNEEGISQAHLLAKRLAEEPWDHIFSSNLQRAAVTAQIVGQAIGKPVTLDARIREKSCGRLEGLTEQERIERWGPEWHRLDHGVESNESIRRRSLDFVADICSRYPGARMIVVSHGAFISQTLKALLQDEETGGPLGNTSITIVRNVNGRWQYVLHNCTRHLQLT